MEPKVKKRIRHEYRRRCEGNSGVLTVSTVLFLSQEPAVFWPEFTKNKFTTCYNLEAVCFPKAHVLNSWAQKLQCWEMVKSYGGRTSRRSLGDGVCLWKGSWSPCPSLFSFASWSSHFTVTNFHHDVLPKASGPINCGLKPLKLEAKIDLSYLKINGLRLVVIVIESLPILSCLRKCFSAGVL